MPRAAKKGRYHHGDLPAALIDTAIELINERGLAGFSLAEASRRLGVTVAAPYRHFADRDELLAAVAVRAARQLVEAVRAESTPGEEPAAELAALARGYLRFAVGHPALFHALFTAGLDKTRHPELRRAAEGVAATVFPAALRVCGDDQEAAEDLALAVGATAHGYASFLLDGTFGTGDEVVESVVARASRAVHDLVRGRAARG
jgi:AcrR family transcriptional regulator